MAKKTDDVGAEFLFEVIETVDASERDALDAIGRFVEAVDQALPGGGSTVVPGRRVEVVEAALKMVEQILGVSNDVARRLTASVRQVLPDFAPLAPDGKAWKAVDTIPFEDAETSGILGFAPGNNAIYFGAMQHAIKHDAAPMRIPFAHIPETAREQDIDTRSADELYLQRERQFKVLAETAHREAREKSRTQSNRT